MWAPQECGAFLFWATAVGLFVYIYKYFKINRMKNFYFLIAAMFIFSGAGAQIINFPDAILKAKLLQTYSWNAGVYDINGTEILIDANNNGEIEVSEALAVASLTLGSNPTDEQNYITDATGLEYFANLKS